MHARSKFARRSSSGGDPGMPLTARVERRPLAGFSATPLILSSKGVARLSFTARIGRAHSDCVRSASKKDGLAAPFTSFRGRAFREHKRSTRLPPPPFMLGCPACRR